MSADEREEEQRFLAELKARSGRDLAEWMAAITAQGFADKNDTIDWLRAQGFPFARASWLERIHTNGGKPIYSDDTPTPPATAPRPQPERPRRGSCRRRRRRRWRRWSPRQRDTVRSTSCSRPRFAVPCPASPSRPRPATSRSAPRASLPPSPCTRPKCASGSISASGPFDAQLQRSRMKGPGRGITHMAVLTDARQVNADLLALLAAANARVNA